MKAFIYAAGFGTRLQPLTNEIPKALVPLRQQPMLQWVIEYLKIYGIREILINTHYLSKKIDAFLEQVSLGVTLETSHEPEILGTGGGLYHTKSFWGDAPFLICNADILCNFDLSAFLACHQTNDSLVTLATNKKVSNSMLLVDEEGTLCGRQKNGKKTFYRTAVGKVRVVGFCGYHIVDPLIFSKPTEKVEFSIIDQYFTLIEQGVKIAGWDIGEAYWVDIGTPETLRQAEIEFPGFV
ncbi:MAG: nucleotidyltransferase [SAR324 cluster bacterium]|uniref:Nucleotidyltransferase n=1 Tax=SAR324 cluster bacterium TaxID=2024889 RepID=A0A2A4T747_9DELT|nr:MAG: nucleotidyltransferase [SAR324 cluster bacterium]